MADSFCDKGDLEIACGGAAQLRQLADIDRSGQPSEKLINDWLESGAADLRAAAEIKHDPEVLANLDDRSLKMLRKMNAKRSAMFAYDEGSKGLAMPPGVARGAEDAETFIEKLKNGERRLGRVVGGGDAAINQPAIGALDYDSTDNLSRPTNGRPNTSGISINAFRANGFR